MTVTAQIIFIWMFPAYAWALLIVRMMAAGLLPPILLIIRRKGLSQ